MTQKEFDKLRHQAKVYDNIDARVKLGSLSTKEYWDLAGGYPYAKE